MYLKLWGILTEISGEYMAPELVFLILKKPAKYGKITLIKPYIREDYRMLADPRNISGLTYNLIKNILSQDNEHVKLKKILNWKDINKVCKSCFGLTIGNKTKTIDIVLRLLILKI